MKLRLALAMALAWALAGQPSTGQPSTEQTAAPAARLQEAYRQEIDAKTRPQACETYSRIAADEKSDSNLRANALLHYGDLFEDCRAAAPGPYASAADVYQKILGAAGQQKIGNEAQQALAANNLASQVYAKERDRAIRVLTEIPFDRIPAPKRAEYRLNLAHLLVYAERWGPAMETYRQALTDGVDPQRTGKEMVAVVGPLSTVSEWKNSWTNLVADAGRALSEAGATAEGALLIRAALERTNEEKEVKALVTGLLHVYSALPVDLDQFSKSEKPWLEKSSHRAVKLIADLAENQLGLWVSESEIPEDYQLLTGPVTQSTYLWKIQRVNPTREELSHFLFRLGDAWAASTGEHHTEQAKNRYTMAWVIAPTVRLDAAIRSAGLGAADAGSADTKKIFDQLQKTYSLKEVDTTELTGPDLSSLFELFTILAEANNEKSLLTRVDLIRALLIRRGIDPAPIPELLQKLAMKHSGKLAFRLYLDAKTDFERVGRLNDAAAMLQAAVAVDPNRDAWRKTLFAGQTALVGLAGATEGKWAVAAELRGPAPQAQAPPTTAKTPPQQNTPTTAVEIPVKLETRPDRHVYYSMTFPALAKGSKLSVKISEGGVRRTTEEAEVPVSNQGMTEFEQPSEGDFFIEGRARDGVRRVTAEVTLPKDVCAQALPMDSALAKYFRSGQVVQHATAVVDPTGAFFIRLDRALRAGEMVAVKETVLAPEANLKPQNPPAQEVGSGPLNWGPVRLYAGIGAQIFNPSGSAKPFLAPILSGTVDATLFGHTLKVAHPLCFVASRPGSGVTLNVFFEAREQPATIMRSKTAGYFRSLPGRGLESGFYLPYVPRMGRYTFKGERHALFIAPILKIGEEYGRDLTGSGKYWAAGLRAGSWKLGRSDGKSAPILQSYYEVLVGRWNRFLEDDTLVRRAPLRYDVSWVGRIGSLPYTFGFRTNFGPGADDYRFNFLLKYELANLLHRVKREGVGALAR